MLIDNAYESGDMLIINTLQIQLLTYRIYTYYLLLDKLCKKFVNSEEGMPIFLRMRLLKTRIVPLA